MAIDVALVEQVGHRSVGDDHAVLDAERRGIVADLPAVERFAVEQADEAFLGRVGGYGHGGNGEQQGTAQDTLHGGLLQGMTISGCRSKPEAPVRVPRGLKRTTHSLACVSGFHGLHFTRPAATCNSRPSGKNGLDFL